MFIRVKVFKKCWWMRKKNFDRKLILYKLNIVSAYNIVLMYIWCVQETWCYQLQRKIPRCCIIVEKSQSKFRIYSIGRLWRVLWRNKVRRSAVIFFPQNPHKQKTPNSTSEVSFCESNVWLTFCHFRHSAEWNISWEIWPRYNGTRLKSRYIENCATWRLKSPTTRLFVQWLIQVNNKENIIDPHYLPCVKGFPTLRGK